MICQNKDCEQIYHTSAPVKYPQLFCSTNCENDTIGNLLQGYILQRVLNNNPPKPKALGATNGR